MQSLYSGHLDKLKCPDSNVNTEAVCDIQGGPNFRELEYDREEILV